MLWNVKKDGDDDVVVGAIDSGGVRWAGDCLCPRKGRCYAARPLMDDACPLMAE